MAVLDRVARGLELLLELISGILIVGMTAVVVYSVVWRYVGGSSPRWYDEVASIMLVWLTYYAGALAALKRGHISVDGVLLMLSPSWRMAAAMRQVWGSISSTPSTPMCPRFRAASAPA